MIERLKKQHNISNDSIVAVRKRIQGDYHTHYHDFFEIEYIADGKGEYLIDGNRSSNNSSDLFLSRFIIMI